MKRHVMTFGLLLVAATSVGQGFTPSCPIPFSAIRQHHGLDDTCTADGNASGPAQKAQNDAKNNLCATGTPAEITPLSFRKLQAKAKTAGVTFGSDSQLPADRSALHDIYTTSNGDTIGEGSLVQLVAFVLDAHYSNWQKVTPPKKPGESVNCYLEGKEDNDIHILLGPSAGTQPCSSVTAEMIPHLRPTGWTDAALNGLNGHPVRLTGHLFLTPATNPVPPGTRLGRRVSRFGRSIRSTRWTSARIRPSRTSPATRQASGHHWRHQRPEFNSDPEAHTGLWRKGPWTHPGIKRGAERRWAPTVESRPMDRSGKLSREIR